MDDCSVMNLKSRNRLKQEIKYIFKSQILVKFYIRFESRWRYNKNENSVCNSVGQSAWSYIQVVGGSNPSARALQGCKSNTNAIVNRL